MVAQRKKWFRSDSRLIVPAAFALGAFIVINVVPFGSFWTTRGQIDATNAQISTLKAQTTLAKEATKSLSSRQRALALARQQYQLVPAHHSLIQVLPGQEASDTQGDPGFAPLVSPASVSPLADPTHTATPVHADGFFQRLVRNLEFWK